MTPTRVYLLVPACFWRPGGREREASSGELEARSLPLANGSTAQPSALTDRAGPGRARLVSMKSFMKNFIVLNIINFTDMVRKEKEEVSWDVKGVLSS